MHARRAATVPGRPRPTLRGRAGAAVVAMVALAAGACSGGTEAAPSSSPSSGPDVVLRVATNDGPDTPTGAAILAFARTVDDLSDGEIRVEPAWEAAGADPDDWDQAVAATVTSGENALGLIPTRAFDVLGVHSLQALQTPFLLTSSARVDAVVRSKLADDLMQGLDGVGLTGLGLFPEDLRRLFAYGEPFTRPAQLDGRGIRAPRSDMTAAVLGSVGARVDDPSGDDWTAAVEAGELAGVESSLAGMAGLVGDHPTVTTTNLVLFPKVNVLVVHRETFEDLTEDHRVLLRQAVQVTAGEPGLVPSERDSAEAFCGAGGRIVAGRPADVAAFEDAMSDTVPPHEPAATRELARAVGDLVEGLPEHEAVPPCRQPSGAAGASPSAAPSETLLVVDTQIGSGEDAASPVIDSAAAFRSCTGVRDVAATMDDSDPAVLRFTGTKRLLCDGGEVVLGYRARMLAESSGSTTGTWRVTASTLAGVRSGGGRLTGDSTACATVPPAEECIRDTFTGSVEPGRSGGALLRPG